MSRRSGSGRAPKHRPRGDDVDTLTQYLDEISAYPLLSREEESSLAVRIHAGDEPALDALVCANLRFVVSIAKKYQHRGVSLPDLIEDGNLGLIRAAERFDETRGVKFISYAVWWVKQAILQTLADNGHAVRVPVGQAGAVYRIGREASSLSQELGRDPTHRELADELEISEDAVEAALPIARGYVSLDAPFSEGSEGNLLDYLPDDHSDAPDTAVNGAGLSESLHEALGRLRGREAEVISLYFGLDGSDPMTLDAIGQRFGITRERVRQIKDKALLRLRSSRQAKLLSAYR
jgi:RNA polymerase primary sigma factor